MSGDDVWSDVAADWSALSETADELLSTVQEQRAGFQQQGQEATTALSELLGAIETSRGGSRVGALSMVWLPARL